MERDKIMRRRAAKEAEKKGTIFLVFSSPSSTGFTRPENVNMSSDSKYRSRRSRSAVIEVYYYSRIQARERNKKADECVGVVKMV